MERIAVLARWPEPGRVKTRLTPALPPPLACELYRGMLSDALQAAERSRAGERRIYWDGAPAGEAERATPAGFECRRQQGPHLGARLEHAFRELLGDGEDRALVIGADCPRLGSALVDQALVALDTHDLVLGPSRDGGYYLIGLRRHTPELFHDVEWGTERVLTRTLGLARAAGLTTALLPELEDIDTPADLLRWIAECVALEGSGSGAAPPHEAPGTTAALRAMRLLP